MASSGSPRINDFDPEDEEAVRQSLLTAIPCFAIGVLTLVAFLLFFLIRCCCFCSGKGCCAKNKTPASRCTVFGHCILALVLLSGAVLGGALLATTGTGVRDALGGLADTFVEQVDKFVDDLAAIIEAILEVAPNDSNMNVQDLQEALVEIQTLQTDVKDVRGGLDKPFDMIKNAVLAVGLSVVFCAVVACVSLVTRKMRVLYIFFLVAMLSCFLTWMLGGIGAAVNIAFDETCTMFDLHLEGVRNAWLDQNLPCNDLAEAMRGMNTAMEAANLAVEDANDAIDDANRQAVAAATTAAQVYTSMPPLCLPYEDANDVWQPNSNPAPGCVALNQSSIEYSYSSRVCDELLPGQGNLATNLQYQACVAEDRPLKREQYAMLLEAAVSFETIAGILPRIQRIASCSFIDDIFQAITDDDCPGMKSSTQRMSLAAICAATALTISALFFCLCFRNVRPQDTQYIVSPETSTKMGTSAKLNRSGPQDVSAPIAAVV